MIDPMNCEEAQALLTRGAQLVDVRTPGEYAAGALPGASNLPVEAIYQWVNNLDREKPVLLYCRSGARSGAATHFLRGAGFREAYNLGAYAAWRDCADAV
ncbi:MAG: rhodanese-like domain-containing protein [Gammaproteobacteria bacterium]|nr:rhodanese-like domain-containing protein [Gammaproteobacteria bacterium]